MQGRNQRAQLDRGGGREACVRLKGGVAPGAELVDPDAHGAVRARGGSCETPREAGVRTPRRDTGARPGERCERRSAAKTGAAVERLRPRDLGTSAREKTGTKCSTGGSHRPGGEDCLDEVAPRLVASLRAVRSVRVCGRRRREIPVPGGQELVVASARRRGHKQDEHDREPQHWHVVPSGP